MVGATLPGGYRVVRPLARGAVATVYLAFDRRGTPYALKVFPKGMDARADREWRVGRGLNHPHVNPVLERLTVAERPAVLLAYAPGARLSDWRLAHPDRPFLPVFRQLLSALAHLHQKGLVHRDVKPENLLVSERGVARLIDFDLSGPKNERLARARLGTLAYLSPEETRGAPPSPASDVYSAGIVLYWGLFGELPFVGSPREVIEAHRHAEVRPPEGAAPPAELWAYLTRLLAKDPKKRYPDARTALKALPPEETSGGRHALRQA